MKNYKNIVRNKLKSRKGSITTLVAVTIFSFMVILMGTYVTTMILRQSQAQSNIRIKEIYEKDIDRIDEIYEELEEAKKAKTTWTQVGTNITSSNGQELEVGDIVLYDYISEATKLSETLYKANTGYTQNQTYTLPSTIEDSDIEWYVLGVEDGKLLLGSSQIKSNNSDGTFYLYGQTGYANAITEFNKISALYGQSRYVDSVRSMKVEDINKVTGYDPEHTGKNKYDGTGTDQGKYGKDTIGQYNLNITYNWGEAGNIDFPTYSYIKDGETTITTGNFRYSHNDSRYGSRFSYYKDGNWTNVPYSTAVAGAEIVTLKNSYYYYFPQTLTTTSDSTAIIGINETTKGVKAYRALFNDDLDNSYYLASECFFPGGKYGYISLHYVVSGHVNYYSLSRTNGIEMLCNSGIRSVVTLKSNVKLTETADGYTLSFKD